MLMSFKFTETKSSSCLHSYLTSLIMCQAAHSFRGLKKKAFTALFYTKNKYYNCLVVSELTPYLLQKRENNGSKGTSLSFNY